MKTIKRIVSSALGISVLFINALPVFAQASTNQTLINASIDVGLDSVETTASIITDSIFSLTIEKTESEPVYEAQPEYIPVYSYSGPYVEVHQESTTMTVDEFLALYGQQEETKTIVETVPVDTSNQEAAYQAALAGYNAALAEFESVNQMIETTKEIEVEIIEEVTDEEGNVSEVVRTEVQTVTEMVPSGDIVSAQANLDAAKAVLDNAQMALDSARNSTVTADSKTTVEEVVQPVVTDFGETQQAVIDEDFEVKEDQTYASSGTCGDGVYWSLDNSGNLTISGSGYMDSYVRGKVPPWSNTIKTVTVSGGIYIGRYAFAGCNSLTSASLASTCTIGADAFMQSTSLRSISIPSSQTTIFSSTFSDCSGLTSVTIPSSVKEIEMSAFSGCSSLTSITIPKSVTYIGSYTFDGCTRLKDVYYKGTQQEWDQISLGSSAFPSGVTMHYSGQSSVVSVLSVSVTPDEKTLYIGDTCQLAAAVSPTNATNKSVTWTTSDSTIATVSSSGLVRAMKAGYAVISVRTVDGNKVAYCGITVKDSSTISVTGVTLNRTSVTLNTGATLQLNATISPSNATNKSVSWTSSNSGIAKVSTSGLVTAVSAGTAVITVTTLDGNKSASCSITVNNPTVSVTGVSLNRTSATLNTGATLQLNATISPTSATNKSVSWTSSNSSIAKVSTSGLVTAMSTGTAVIRVTTQDGNYQASCSITVNNPTVSVTGVSLNKTSATLDKGDSLQLIATVSPSNATNKNVIWSSSDTSVATVSSNGLVNAINTGTTLIIVLTKDGGYRDSCSVTVSDAGINKCGENAYWRLENDELYIYGTGDIYDYSGLELPFDGDVPDYRIMGFAPWGTSIKSVTFESGITGIGDNSFYDCGELTSVTVPNGVTIIGRNAFERCTHLTQITIPDSLTYIGHSAFSGCSQLKDVYYQGTEIDWNEKNLYSFDNSITIHFIGIPFTDVPEDAWYYSVAKECYETGLISGTSATTFSPMQTMTRAMIVTILWRMEGQPKTAFNNQFKDVSSSQWYASSISWAANNGVVNGYGDGTFKPDAAVTREQVAVMLANYAQYKGVYVPGTKKLNTYPDGSQVSSWAQAGMKWALTNGIISGNGAGYLNPKKSATRAEGAAMLLRMKNWL